MKTSRIDILRARSRKLALARLRLAEADPASVAGDAPPPMTFREYVDRVRPGYVWYEHCVALANVLQRVADGELDRVMVFMPPRHGKSELVSRLFSGYYLYRHPERWVGLNSYGAELAYTLSRAARLFFDRAGGKVRSDAAAVKHWETEGGGGLWAAGVGGPITGKGFHLGIIDDPIKNAQDAASEVIRAGQKEWYGSTFYTRAEPNAAIVVVQTRWNEDDLSGHLLATEKAGDADPERWHIVNMPAIQEAPHEDFPATCTVEPDPRPIGAALCPERYPLSRLNQILRTVGSYIFGALFQQRPAPREGGMFKSFPVVGAIPSRVHWVRYWDKAATHGSGDFTAGVKMGLDLQEKVFYLADIVHGQWSAAEREKIIEDTASADGIQVHIWVEQEGGSGGKESAENTVKRLAGYIAKAERVTGAKEVRAEPMAAQAEIGNVKLLRGDWNQKFIDQARAFPNGRHDDMIDAASGAFNKLALMLRPGKTEVARPKPVPPVPTATGRTPGIPHALGRRR